MTSLPPKIRIAIIGTGLIGPRHAQAVINSENAELVAIVEPTTAGEQIAATLKAVHYRSANDLIRFSHTVDGAIICTPNHTHVPLSQELSAAGIHILIEKPISTDVSSGKELLSRLEQTNVKVLVGHHRRFNPFMVTAKKIVASGELGRIIGVNGLWALYKPPQYFDPPTDWRRHATGGVVLINMVHEVDLLHHLLGSISTVHGERTVSQRGFEAEEGAALTLRFRSGAVGSFFLCDTVPSPWNFESGTGENPTIPSTGQDFYRIFGTEASLSVPDMSVWSYHGTQKSWNSDLVRNSAEVSAGVPFELQVDHFCKVIRGEETPSCTAQVGLAALIVCQAIKEALADNITEGIGVVSRLNAAGVRAKVARAEHELDLTTIHQRESVEVLPVSDRIGSRFVAVAAGATAFALGAPGLYSWTRSKTEHVRRRKLATEFRLWLGIMAGPLLPIILFWLGWTNYSSVSKWSGIAACFLFGMTLTALYVCSYEPTVDTYGKHLAIAFACIAMVRYLIAGGMAIATRPCMKASVCTGQTWLGGIAVSLTPASPLFWRLGPKKSKRAANDST
ncbi:hypothetical protein SCARD494_12840 [Seiridium cardinale]